MTKRKPGRRAPTLCLVDGTALAYRSHYAFIRNPLLNSRGENVSAVFGFARELLRLLEDLDPAYVAVAFDTPEPTFRHEEYEDYKANREEAPDEMIEQLPAIYEIVEAIGVPILEVPGYEADDVIGTLATRARDEGLATVIVSGDKDFFQLVGDGVTVVDPSKGIEYTPELVEEKFGVPPERVTEVLGLMGDASDNVPGIPGIGKKTATDLVRTYGTIEGVLDNIEEIGGPKRRANLEEFAEQGLESRRLVTIVTDAPVERGPSELERAPVDVEQVTELFGRLELPSLLRRVLPDGGRGAARYSLVKTRAALGKLAGSLEASDGFAVDLETTSLDPQTAEIVGLAIAIDEEEAFYVPVGHREGGLDTKAVIDRLKSVLEDGETPKYGHNLKFDYEILRAAGVEMAGIRFDTMIASYLLDPGRRQHGLAALAAEHLGRSMTPIGDLIGSGGDQLAFSDVSLESARDYACADAEVTLRLRSALEPRIVDEGLEDVMNAIEMPLIPVLAGMELAGVPLDVDLLERLSEDYGRRLDELEAEIHGLSGCEFNLGSPKQVSEVLFERLGLPRGRRTKTGYSTDVRVLGELAREHEIPRLLLEHRQLAKLKAGYLDALPKLVNPVTGRVHTSFNQTVAATGRLSSSNPNLQNIPMRTELGREIRRAFVAGEGRALLSADYSQIELRIMAHLSADAELRRAFEEGRDFHRTTAALVFRKSEEEVTQAERDWAKAINFGIMYGMTPFGLAKQLGVESGEAAEFIETYLGTYPGVREYTARAIHETAASGYSVTLLGRRRRIDGLDSENARVRGFAERTAVNTPIQGSAADLIKLAMIGIARRIRTEGLPCEMVLQVHDELVFEVERGALENVSAAVREEMEGPEGFRLDVPIVVNIGSGPTWYEAH